VARWEHPVTHPRNSFPGITELHRIAGYLGIDFLWLLTGLYFTETSTDEPGKLRPIRALQGVQNSKPLGYKQTSGPTADNAWWFRIEDEDNTPEFVIGEFCLVDANLRPSPGKMVVAQLPRKGLNVFRQYTVYAFDDDRNPLVKLRALNPSAPSFSVEKEDIAICAVLVEHVRDMSRHTIQI